MSAEVCISVLSALRTVRAFENVFCEVDTDMAIFEFFVTRKIEKVTITDPRFGGKDKHRERKEYSDFKRIITENGERGMIQLGQQFLDTSCFEVKYRYGEWLAHWGCANTCHVGSFTTDFSFVIDSRSLPDYGDGLAFLLTGDNFIIR
ncbi:hypothetical protein LXL04_017118 [Taraxacum kok-saghyz]